MSLFKASFESIRAGLRLEASPLAPLVQIRTATKKVSGSKTNKNDSAGRRLGPKVHESNFVKPGQIIMRQRGTKIHPGENTGIGKDHTIFALEPGYIRFYYDPFHPLRKYVGVALKKDLTLPTPHFSPRVRRFGYVEIEDPVEAEKEESHMSRKEYLQQPELKKNDLKSQQKDKILAAKIKSQITGFLTLGEGSESLVVKKLLDVYKLTKLGQTIEEANLQCDFNYIYNLQLALKNEQINEEKFNESKQSYEELMAEVNSKVTIDHTGNLAKYLTEAERLSERSVVLTKLSEFKDKLITKEMKSTISELIETPLLFNKGEEAILLKEYLPSVLPETVQETVLTDINPKKVPKNVQIVRKFDNSTKEIQIIGRTKEAFL